MQSGWFLMFACHDLATLGSLVVPRSFTFSLGIQLTRVAIAEALVTALLHTAGEAWARLFPSSHRAASKQGDI